VWLKENLLNLAIQRLPSNWKYVAWIDADVLFARPNWVHETIHQLQHYAFVQLWSDAVDLDPDHRPIAYHTSYAWCHHHGERPVPPFGHGHGPYGSGGRRRTVHHYHPGFAWAARRDALDAVGGLIDWAALGAADNHMAQALLGDVENSVHPSIHGSYRRWLIEWQARCDREIKRNVGYVSGLLTHYWHGKKVDRRYWDRWQILARNTFDPELDLKRDAQGLWQLTRRNPQLRDDIRTYMRGRNEDSIDV
jgi:hypothetical protein